MGIIRPKSGVFARELNPSNQKRRRPANGRNDHAENDSKNGTAHGRHNASKKESEHGDEDACKNSRQELHGDGIQRRRAGFSLARRAVTSTSILRSAV